MKRLSLDAVLTMLKQMYHPPKSFLVASSPFELLIATIMSARCTDALVNKRSPAVFAKYPTPQAFAEAPLEQLREDVRFCGPYKAPYIQSLSKILVDTYNGAVPDSMEALVQLPGVGRKTAAVVLHAVFDKHEGIAVDTHVMRLSRRMGFTKEKTQEKIELDLMHVVPKKEWGNVNTYLISHGRAVCTARNRACERCVFADVCPSSRTHGLPDLAKDQKPTPTKRAIK
jgi:endonuclease-3